MWPIIAGKPSAVTDAAAVGGADGGTITFRHSPWYGENIRARVQAINAVDNTDATGGGVVLPANTATFTFLEKGAEAGTYVARLRINNVPNSGRWRFKIALVSGALEEGLRHGCKDWQRDSGMLHSGGPCHKPPSPPSLQINANGEGPMSQTTDIVVVGTPAQVRSPTVTAPSPNPTVSLHGTFSTLPTHSESFTCA